jgi:phosphate transport system protein
MIERRILSKEELNIRDGLQQLSDAVQTAIASVCDALNTLDIPLCESIVVNDKTINTQYSNIEQICLTTIATQQPVATDLRVLVAALHINVELERIADHMASIAKSIIKMANETPLDEIGEVIKMANVSKDMLHQAIQAYITSDFEQALVIAEKDREIDDMQTRISNDIIKKMCENTSLVPYGSYLLWIVHGLERVGDRATNICEQIVYVKKGVVPDLN